MTVQPTSNEYEMTLSLNVLEHLGLNLYSSNPAVLSEAVANAWDADATRVDINLDIANGKIVLSDDGDGMTKSDINDRFLRVGYQRRNESSPVTKFGRPVMGRKGIGKLALFGIADEILVETAKDSNKCALSIKLTDIKAVMSVDDPSKSQTYNPSAEPTDSIDFEHGTRITLTNLRKGIDKTTPYLRKRLARRFTILGASANFRVFVNGEEVDSSDMDLLPLAQYLWLYTGGALEEEIISKATELSGCFRRIASVNAQSEVAGWIATARTPTALKAGQTGESYNRIPIFVRGKMAQEDILDEFDEVGIYRSYLFGEIHADFLDLDTEPDIATSSRQKIKEDDSRYSDLKEWVRTELAYIKTRWSDLRNKSGAEDAVKNPEIEAWFKELDGDRKRRAERLFGKINELGLEERDRVDLYAYGILAFETMSQKDNLDALDQITATDLQSLSKVLRDTADLEAAMYLRIVRSRLAVIEKLEQLVDDNELERVLQEYLFEHLWLLDPGWERATMPTMEQKIGKIFAAVSEKIKDDERDSRYDIRYQRTSGLNVIVELKRADVRTSSTNLISQVEKYRNALLDYLQTAGRGDEPVEVVCVVGKPLSDWTRQHGRFESARMLEAKGIRVVQYQELLLNAQYAYREYLNEREKLGRVQRILDSLVQDSDDESAKSV